MPNWVMSTQTADFLKMASDKRKQEQVSAQSNRPVPVSQPDDKTEIRAAAVKLLLALDADLESVAERFVGWWTNRRIVHCRQAANGELNPSPQPSEPSHQ